jgi:hypothetical protein
MPSAATVNIRAKLHEHAGKRGKTWSFDYNLKGHRIRSPRYADKKVAEYEMEKVQSRYEIREAYQPTHLTREQIKDAEAAIVTLQTKYKIKTLTEAATWFVQHFRDASSSEKLATACDGYLTSVQGRRERTQGEYRSHFKDLKAEFGVRTLAELTTADFQEYLNKPAWGQITRWHRRQTASRLYRWAMALKPPLAFENPLDGIGKMRKRDLRSVLPAIAILEPDEAKKLLQSAVKTEFIAFAVLGMFAGMRREEIQRFAAQPGGGWEEINFNVGTIQIGPTIGKRGKRVIQINKTLKRWLDWVKKDGRMDFYPPNLNKGWHAVRIASLPTAKLRRTNLSRHSFITYSLRMPKASYAQVARDAGTSEGTIREYYEDIQATAKMAATYWALTPARILKSANTGSSP